MTGFERLASGLALLLIAASLLIPVVSIEWWKPLLVACAVCFAIIGAKVLARL